VEIDSPMDLAEVASMEIQVRVKEKEYAGRVDTRCEVTTRIAMCFLIW